ncbi:ATPase domain-containing protein [Hyalangium versicolor]|uniref:ATPase domain-containing protein n=1 Tax=Hyalangium versicolor TaxID=2861190 RepID=UPI001CCA3207|nr:ATPase domain-containing protein [Hyalangium versicolor]
MRSSRSVIPSGVPGFDALLGGGLPARQSLLITGQPGTGKTILASQVAFHTAAAGTPVVVATTTSESQAKLLEDLAGFSFFSRARLGEELFFLSIYSWLKKGAREARDILINTIRERKARLLVVDGLRSVRDLWQDEAKLREFFYELSVGLATVDCTAIFITEYPLSKLIEYPESTTVDGIISLSFDEGRLGRIRRAEVVKLRGMKHLTGRHVMLIDGSGIRILPRMEAVTASDVDFVPPEGRAAFGLPELDALLDGGLPLNSAALVAGSTGVGKTLLGLHFAAECTARGEKALVFTTSEPSASLVARARRVSLELQPLLSSGALTIQYAHCFELEADEIVAKLLAELERSGARRLVFEDVDVLERSLENPARARAFFGALLIRLRNMGISALFTRKISKLVGPELDFSESPLANIAENLLFMRHVELHGRLHRVLSILNLRNSRFDPSLREFEIRDSGLRVLEPLRSAEGLLTGVARPLGMPRQEAGLP